MEFSKRQLKKWIDRNKETAFVSGDVQIEAIDINRLLEIIDVYLDQSQSTIIIKNPKK